MKIRKIKKKILILICIISLNFIPSLLNWSNQLPETQEVKVIEQTRTAESAEKHFTKTIVSFSKKKSNFVKLSQSTKPFV